MKVLPMLGKTIIYIYSLLKCGAYAHTHTPAYIRKNHPNGIRCSCSVAVVPYLRPYLNLYITHCVCGTHNKTHIYVFIIHKLDRKSYYSNENENENGENLTFLFYNRFIKYMSNLLAR